MTAAIIGPKYQRIAKAIARASTLKLIKVQGLIGYELQRRERAEAARSRARLENTLDGILVDEVLSDERKEGGLCRSDY